MGDFLDLFLGDWMGRTILAVILTATVIVGYVLYREVDSWHLTEGEVVSKSFSPAHTTTVFMPVGKMLIPTQQRHPDTWKVTIQGVDDRGKVNTRTVRVSRETFERVVQGQRMKIE